MSSFSRCSRQTVESNLLLRCAQILIHAHQLLGDALGRDFIAPLFDRQANLGNASFVHDWHALHSLFESSELPRLVRYLYRAAGCDGSRWRARAVARFGHGSVAADLRRSILETTDLRSHVPISSVMEPLAAAFLRTLALRSVAA